MNEKYLVNCPYCSHCRQIAAKANWTPKLVLDVVAKTTRITVAVLISKQRDQVTAAKRHIAIYVVRVLTGVIEEEVGKVFNRDHSTVVYAIQQVQQAVKDHRRHKEVANLLQHCAREVASRARPRVDSIDVSWLSDFHTDDLGDALPLIERNEGGEVPGLGIYAEGVGGGR